MTNNNFGLRKKIRIPKSKGLLQEAFDLHQAGKLTEAAALYNKILEDTPDNADAAFLRGTLYLQQGNHGASCALLEKSIALKPDNAMAHNNLGTALKEQGELDKAVICYKRAIELKPDYTEAHNNLGITLQESGKLDEAVMCYKRVVKLKPDHVIAYNNLGAALKGQGSLDKAVMSYKRAVELKPDYALAYNNLGAALKEQGKLDEAVNVCRQAITIMPDYAEAYNNLGALFQEQGKLENAVENYNRAIEIRPAYADAYYNIGNVYMDMGDMNKAISCYEKALHIKPDYAQAYNNMGNAFRQESKINEAISCYEKALHIKPDFGIEIKKALTLPVICESNKLIAQYRRKIFEQIESLKNKGLTLEDPHRQVGSTVFYLAHQWLNDKEIQEKIASFYIHICPDLVWTPPSNHKKQQQPHNKIKVGVISNFLCSHTIGLLNHGIVKNLSRKKFHVKLFRFQGGMEDNLSKAIDGAADEVIVLPTKLKPARQKIADQSLDILFYLDIGMDSLTYFLAFSRLASVQCVTWGHPVTTGED